MVEFNIQFIFQAAAVFEASCTYFGMCAPGRCMVSANCQYIYIKLFKIQL